MWGLEAAMSPLAFNSFLQLQVRYFSDQAVSSSKNKYVSAGISFASVAPLHGILPLYSAIVREKLHLVELEEF